MIIVRCKIILRYLVLFNYIFLYYVPNFYVFRYNLVNTICGYDELGA